MDYIAPFRLDQEIVLNLVASQANGNLGNLAGSPLATSQYNSDTVPADTTFNIAPTFQWIIFGPITINGLVNNSGQIHIL